MAVVEVVDKEFDKTVRFDALEVGETFRYDGKIYLKWTMSCGGDTMNAFGFQDNALAYFSGGSQVYPVNCKLVVEG